MYEREGGRDRGREGGRVERDVEEVGPKPPPQQC